MSRRKRKDTPDSLRDSSDRSGSPPDSIEIGAPSEKRKVRWKPFPGPRGIEEPVRLCLSRTAYAELIAHAKERLDVEVCGVLIGEFCEDEEGPYISVNAVIAGHAAKQSGTHVTFTQETWNSIHERRERDYPKSDIVGWYHTHPGFGVEFSEMDLFIQRNFFSGPGQVAFLTDPLGGAEAACVNTETGIHHLSGFCVDGRERQCHAPERRHATTELGASAGTLTHLEQSIQAVENRLRQLIQVVDEQRNAAYRFLMFLGMLAGTGIVAAVGYSIYTQYLGQHTPPQRVRFADIPVQIGDDTYLLGVETVRWKMPQAMAAKYIEAVKSALQAEEEARKKQAEEQGKEKETEGQGQEGASPSPDSQPSVDSDDTDRSIP